MVNCIQITFTIGGYMELRTCPQCHTVFKVYPSEVAKGWDKYCSWSCFNLGRKANPEQRFWKHVDRSGEPDACWPWIGGTSHNGYGRFWLDGHTVPASHYAYEIGIGPVPPGMLVLHHCDNPPCCNPTHLFIGTQLDNVHDRDAKGRAAQGDASGARLHPEKWSRGDRHWTRSRPDLKAKYIVGDNNPSHKHRDSRPRGENNAAAKLTWPQVREIRHLYASGNYTFKALGKQFGVSAVNIRQIIRERTWREVSQP
jgi:hypothetical protein